MKKFGNGGAESPLGSSVGGQVGIALDGLGVFGAFEGFAVDGFRVGGVFSVGVNVLTGQCVGFLFEVGEAGTEGTKVGNGVGFPGVNVISTLGRGMCSTRGWYVRIGFFLGSASFVLIAATPARKRHQRGAVCFMVQY